MRPETRNIFAGIRLIQQRRLEGYELEFTRLSSSGQSELTVAGKVLAVISNKQFTNIGWSAVESRIKAIG